MRIIGFFLLVIFFNPLSSQSVFDNKGLVSYKGLFDFHYHESEDKIYLEVIDLNESFLYINSLSQGVGSNDLGLDRGQ